MYVLGVFVCFKANVNVMTRGRERRGPLQTGGVQLNKKKKVMVAKEYKTQV